MKLQDVERVLEGGIIQKCQVRSWRFSFDLDKGWEGFWMLEGTQESGKREPCVCLYQGQGLTPLLQWLFAIYIMTWNRSYAEMK